MSNQAGLSPGIADPALRDHLRELFESSSFKGSRRSQQFLQHIVEKALAGQADELKERSLGVALFGRAPSYDTGEDAVVRVTASDVRKRLHQYYSETESPVRVELLAGSYTPEFRYVSKSVPEILPSPAVELVAKRGAWWRIAAILGAVLILGILLWNRQKGVENPNPRKVLPWSVLLKEERQLQLVLADPDVSVMQELSGSQITLSDYANRRYLARPEALSTDMREIFRHLRGANVATADVGIAVAISRLAGSSSARMKINTARSMQLSAFRSDDDFVILGSYRSNPWGMLFEDQLEFDFVRHPGLKGEIVRNKKVQPGELARYVPTAGGWDTGDSFAIVALVGNPNQAGNVLLIAGTNAEGTEAAGQFVTNTVEVARTLRAHGIDPGGPLCHFEILLRVRAMAGSPNTHEIVAFHLLPARTSP